MSSISPEMQTLARWLMERESPADKASARDGLEAVRICEKLRKPLGALAGVAGYYSLVSRALTLAKTEAESLGVAHFQLDGSLHWEGSADPQERQAAADRGGEILVAHLLSLLATFIGQRLTICLVRDIWPDAPFGDADSVSETGS